MSPSTSTTWRNCSRPPTAWPRLRRSCAGRWPSTRKSVGAEHPRVATELSNLALLLQDTDRLTEAEPLMRRALAIDEQSFGTEHPKVAINLNNLAQLLRATNHLTEAESLMRRHLEIFLLFTQRTGHEHPHPHAAVENYRACSPRWGAVSPSNMRLSMR